MLLGLPPDWYKDHRYRSRAVSEPRAVLREFGTIIPDDAVVRVHDSTAEMRYLYTDAARRHGRLERRAACRDRGSRQHDRRGGHQALA